MLSITGSATEIFSVAEDNESGVYDAMINIIYGQVRRDMSECSSQLETVLRTVCNWAHFVF